MSQNDDDGGTISTPPELKQAAATLKSNVIPQVSADQYNDAGEKFENWLESKCGAGKSVSENVVMAYFAYLKENGNTKSGEGLKGSSRMSIMSRLKTYLLAKHGFDSISKCWTTIARTIQDDMNQEPPKQAKTFTQQQLDDFFTRAPNDDNWLVTKVAASVAIVCGNRPSELYNMLGDDVKRLDNGGWEITVSKRKTQKRHAATFVVPPDVDGPTSPLRYLPAYMALRAEKQVDGHEPLFWQVRRGKMTKQRVGENSFNEMTKNMASFLELADAEQYTGYALRRSSATLAAENGANSMQMKTHFGWKNDKMANRYVDSTTKSKAEMSRLIAGACGTNISHAAAVPPTDVACARATSTTAAFSRVSSMLRPPTYAHEQQQPQRSFLSELGSAFNFSNNNGTVNIVFNVGSKKRTAGDEENQEEEHYVDVINE
jgi:integrase